MPTLLEKVAKKKNLELAWTKIKHRANSKGLDMQTIRDFKVDLQKNLKGISVGLSSGTYNFTKLRGHALDRPEKATPRPLKIPAVKDRVVQKSIHLVIEKFLNRKYRISNPTSFAYIKDRSVMDAIKKVRDLRISGYKWIYIADIENFFNTVPPKKLLEKFIFPVLPDTSLNKLIESALTNEIGNSAELSKAGKLAYFPNEDTSIAQGGILSPLFANVYLSGLDQAMIKHRFKMVRYADDFMVLCKTEKRAKDAFGLAQKIVETELGLKLHTLGSGKSKIGKFGDLEFLGMRFRGDKIYPGPKAFKKMIGLLQAFKRRPLKANLVENLNFLKFRVQAWAMTYFYTETEKVIYTDLDLNLTTALVNLMKSYGFRLHKNPLTKKQLDKIGIPNFSDKIHEVKIQRAEQIKNFNNPLI